MFSPPCRRLIIRDILYSAEDRGGRDHPVRRSPTNLYFGLLLVEEAENYLTSRTRSHSVSRTKSRVSLAILLLLPKSQSLMVRFAVVFRDETNRTVEKELDKKRQGYLFNI